MSDKLTAKEVALIIHENGKMNERDGGSDKEDLQTAITLIEKYRQNHDDTERMTGCLLEVHKVLSKMNYNPNAKNINRLHHGIKFALDKAGINYE